MPGSPANIEVSSKNQMINHTGSNIWNKSVNSVASIKTLKIEKKLDWSWKERKRKESYKSTKINFPQIIFLFFTVLQLTYINFTFHSKKLENRLQAPIIYISCCNHKCFKTSILRTTLYVSSQNIISKLFQNANILRNAYRILCY